MPLGLTFRSACTLNEVSGDLLQAHAELVAEASGALQDAQPEHRPAVGCPLAQLRRQRAPLHRAAAGALVLVHHVLDELHVFGDELLDELLLGPPCRPQRRFRAGVAVFLRVVLGPIGLAVRRLAERALMPGFASGLLLRAGFASFLLPSPLATNAVTTLPLFDHLLQLSELLRLLGDLLCLFGDRFALLGDRLVALSQCFFELANTSRWIVGDHHNVGSF